jgi:hypothetical protein
VRCVYPQVVQMSRKESKAALARMGFSAARRLE